MKKLIICFLLIFLTINLFSQYTFNSPTDSNNAYENQVFSPYTQFFGGVITGLAVALPFNMFAKENFPDISDKLTYMYLGYTFGSALGICLFSNELDLSSGLLMLLGSGIGGAIGYFTNSWELALLFPPAVGVVFNNYFSPTKCDNSNGFSFKMTETSQIIKTMPEDRSLNYKIDFRFGL